MTTYDWQRFWIPRENVDRIRTGGFLYDPQGKYSEALSPGVVPLSVPDLAEHPLLILLGEPAAGKSQAVRDYTERLRSNPISGEDPSSIVSLPHLLDAKAAGSQLELRREFEELLSSGSEIFIDSVDEVTVVNMDHFIPALIHKSVAAGSRLRLVCRTAALTPRLENAILKAAKRENIEPAFYVLAQLRETDLRVVAQDKGFALSGFLTEIRRLNAGDFAAQAGNLLDLADVFAATGHLPVKQWDLWDEQNLLTIRLAHKATTGEARPQNDPYACRNLLARVAATTIFGGQIGIASPQVSVAREGLLRIDDVADRSEEEWNDGEEANSVEMSLIVGLAPLAPSADPSIIVWPTRPRAEFLA